MKKWSAIAFSKKNTWKQKTDVLESEKGLQLIKLNTLSVINHLFWHGTGCPLFSFCVQQQVFEYSDSYKARASKVSRWAKSQVPDWFAQKVINNKLFAKAVSLIDKVLHCPRIKLSNSQTLVLDGLETRVLLSNFAQQLCRRNAHVLNT